MFKKKIFIGRTIVGIDTTIVNYVTFTFSDGGKVAMEIQGQQMFSIKNEFVVNDGVFSVELNCTTEDNDGPAIVKLIFNNTDVEFYECESWAEAAGCNNLIKHNVVNILKCLIDGAKVIWKLTIWNYRHIRFFYKLHRRIKNICLQ